MEPIKPGSKYYPLHKHLISSKERSIFLSFQEIERILGVALPRSARTSKAFWSNRSKGALQARAWMSAGYHVLDVNFGSQLVTFEKPDIRYEVKVEGDTVLWTGAMVRSLRHYLKLNQAEFSKILGVRQQTVSEWENQIYQPTRSRSKHLSMVAEQAGYRYMGLDGEKSAKGKVDKNTGTVYNVNNKD
jgi:DNA-binding transcriptional regulator YiaG